MLKIKKILFPTDYSACAEHAFSQAAYLAERYDADLHVLHVTEPSLEQLTFDITEADVAADLHLPEPTPSDEQVPEEGGMRNVEVPPLKGSVVRAILDYADQHDIDVIVMGTHGRSGAERLLLGSVAGKIVRLATCPVFTVRQDTETGSKGTIRRILAPIDFSEHARLAVAYAYATDLAATYEAHLDLLHGIEQIALPAIYGIEPPLVQIPDIVRPARRALEQVADEARRAGVSVQTHVHIGHPSHDIIDFAEDQGADLIVIATHGLTGLKRFFLGSVAEKVVQSAPCPVFTVKGFGKRLLPQTAAVAPSEQHVPVS